MKIKFKKLKENDIIKLYNGNKIKILKIIKNYNRNLFKINIISNKNINKNDNIKYIVLFNDEELKLSEIELIKLIKIQNNTIFTHNCMEKIVCGQLGSIASRMILDDNQATTIDGKHKGAGIVKAQGQLTHVQYYYGDPKWIKEWFTKRGMDEKGWDKNNPNYLEDDKEEINLGEDEEFTINKDIKEISFNGVTKEIDNTRDQKFKEV